MNPNVLLMTLVIALEPIPVLGGVLLLTSKHGRPKAIGAIAEVEILEIRPNSLRGRIVSPTS